MSDDHSEIEVRRLTRDDAAALAEGFRRLSEDSAYERFHEVLGGLSGAQLEYFTDIDHHDHEAVTAVETSSGELVGVARYIRNEWDRTRAEVAVVVIDAYHDRGVGEQLIDELAGRARAEGVERFVGDVLTDNSAMLALLRRLGEVDIRTEDGETTATVPLGRVGPS